MNKGDIEKVKKHYIFTTEHELDDDNKTLKEYIEYLEQKEFILDKVTDKLEEDIEDSNNAIDIGEQYYLGKRNEAQEILNIIEGDEE